MLNDRRRRGFTLIELLVVVALAAVVLTIAAPSFRDYIAMQRLKGTSAQLTTDLQLARAEAATRQEFGRVIFGNNASASCYTIFALKVGGSRTIRCDCQQGPGAACAASSEAIEIKTVKIDKSSGVAISVSAVDPLIAFDPVTGGLYKIPSDDATTALPEFVVEVGVDAGRTLRTTINGNGRPTVCGVTSNLGQPTC